MTKAPKKPRSPVKSADSLVNVVSGLGTAKAKRSHNQFQYSLVSNFQQLDAAYTSNWLARQIVDVPAEDMTREWRTIKCDGADDIRAEEDRIQVHTKISEAVSWSRLYGGSAILMLTGQDLEKPLQLDKIKKGGLLRLIVLDRFDVQPMQMNSFNVLAANYLEPEFYIITGGAQKIHWSHFARFLGAKLPRRQRIQTLGWGDSELRKCLDDIMDTVASKDGIAELMQEANIDVITRDELMDELGTDQDSAIVSRYALFSQMKSNLNMALLDGGEKLERMTLNLSGVAPVLETFMTWISGAADIPVTRLFGTSAKGMNATGEGDMSNYHASLSSKRMYQVDPGLRVLDEVLVRSALGFWPDDFNYVWNPMAQPNLAEIAASNKANAERDVLYLDSGVITKSQVMRRLQAEELYQLDDDKIAELEEYEDDTMFDEPLEPEMDNIDRTTSADAAPSTLYIRRDVKNSSDIIAWAKSQGITKTLDASDMHVTVAFSKQPVDWMKAGETFSSREDGGLSIRPGGPRMIEQFGAGAIVLAFNSADLSWRHEAIKEIGASWDWPEYQPHITITYDSGDLDISTIKPYSGAIELGPEIFEQINPKWISSVKEADNQ